ncbi:MAG TPA: hypothetical protein VNJ08_06280 [Bacteriovoracaceae bacterium]|nr:hypothetical protein [Bacteriovoracaceae bacterium]
MNRVLNRIAANFAVYNRLLIFTILRIKLHPDNFTTERTLYLEISFH